MVKAVRGAVSLDQNTENNLTGWVDRLFNEILKKNNIKIDEIVSIIFSQTQDITFNPAKALRLSNNITETPLFCTQEPVCEDFTHPLMLRILITYNTESSAKAVPVYLGNAQDLRRDISGA